MKALRNVGVYQVSENVKTSVFVGPQILFWAIVVFTLAILSGFPYEFYRLLASSDELAAIDLIQRYEEVQTWFSGAYVYELLDSAVYPPASYLMMWPFMGFTSWELTRWIWALTSIFLTAFLTKELLKSHSVHKFSERIFWGLFICAHYSTGITIGNGQLTNHIMAALAAALIFLKREETSWKQSLFVGFFAALSLIKPTVSVPFMWMILFVSKNIYPALFTGLIYTLSALFSSLFQQGGLFQLHLDWLSLGVSGAAWSSTASSSEGALDTLTQFSNAIVDSQSNPRDFLLGDIGYGDIHSILGAFDGSHWALPSSLILLFVLGLWIYLHRNCSVWTLMGTAAIFSRIWTYHRVYDDMLIIFAIFAIVSILQQRTYPNLFKVGKRLLFVLVIASLVPSSLRLLPFPLDLIFKLGQLSLWMLTLLYLLYSAHIEKRLLQANSNSSFSN